MLEPLRKAVVQLVGAATDIGVATSFPDRDVAERVGVWHRAGTSGDGGVSGSWCGSGVWRW